MSEAPKSVVYVGIDMGSGVTRVALLEPSKKMPVIVRNNLSNESTPTSVAMVSGEARVFGDNAVSKEVSRPECAVGDLAHWLFCEPQVLRAVGDIDDLTATRAAGYFLRNIIGFVPAPQLIDAVVCLAVPPSTDAACLRAAKTALKIAGLVDDTRTALIDSTEASLVYLHHLQRAALPSADGEAPGALVVVVDIGKSHCRVVLGSFTVDKVTKVDAMTIRVGSDSIDNALAERVAMDVERKHPQIDVRGHKKSMAKVLRECRKAKEMLSSVDTARVQVESLKDDVDVNIVFSRKDLEDCASSFLSSLRSALMEFVQRNAAVLQRPETATEGTVRVEAIGAGWRAVAVQDVLKQCLGVSKIGVSLDCNLAVAEGCAIMGACKRLGQDGVRSPAAPEEVADSTRDTIHDVVLEGFSADVEVTSLSGDEYEVLASAEAALRELDEKIHSRIRAINSLDAFILQVKDASYRCHAPAARQEEIRSAIAADEAYVRDECLGEDEEAIAARHSALVKTIETSFPEIAALREAEREEQKRKDEELERLQKLQSEDKELKSDPQRLRVAQQRREQGQTLFKQEHWAEAQTRFVQALSILGELYDVKDPENKRKKDEISLSCHLNIASCSIKLHMWRNALNNASSALDLSPNNPKALFRRGQAASMLNDFATAKRDLELAKQLTNGDAAIVGELEAVLQKEAAEVAKEKKMFARMFA